jgi:hypothetical protein
MARGDRGAPHARAACFLATVLIATGCGRSPYMALLALLVTAFDAIWGMVSGIVGRCLLLAAWGHLPAHLCGAVCSRLVVDGVLGGDTTQILERVSWYVTTI